MAIQLISKATKAISDEATSKSLVAVFEDPAYVENPVMRAHKFEMAFSKVLKAAFKEFGFTAGVDCKKALRQLDLEKYEDEGVKAAMEVIPQGLKPLIDLTYACSDGRPFASLWWQTFQETYKMIEEHRGEAQPPKKEEASEPA